jgi:two-component system response regulator RegX3
MAKVLVVDSDAAFLAKVRESLGNRNHQVVSARTLEKAIERLRRHHPDIVILDPFLPDSEDYDACRQLRLETSVPLMVITDNDEEFDKVVAFELGADDYVTKPVSMRELQAGVAARLRLVNQALGGVSSTPVQLSASGLALDLVRREASKNGHPLNLRHKEFQLLALLMQHRGRTMTRAEIVKQVWGYEVIGSTRTVDVHIDRLRKKIEVNPADPRYIVTQRGMGYRFEG